MTARAPSTPTRPRWVRVLGELVETDGVMMVLALIITVVLFVLTRDEVTRRFSVPLRVQPDPARVLLTEVPDTIAVDVRGPWTRVNRVDSADFGVAVLDLRKAEPGPLIIDRASIVMPQGVVLAGVDYDEVDLRFEPVIERDVPVVPTVIGSPAADYQLVSVAAEPPTLRIRGGQSEVLGLAQLTTESYDLRDATADVAVSLALARPPPGIEVVDGRGDRLSVRVTADVEPKPERAQRRVTVERDATLAERAGLPTQVQVELRGAAPAFRELERIGGAPVVARARPDPGAKDRAIVEVEWAAAVPPAVRASVAIDPLQVVVELPPVAPTVPAAPPVDPTP